MRLSPADAIVQDLLNRHAKVYMNDRLLVAKQPVRFSLSMQHFVRLSLRINMRSRTLNVWKVFTEASRRRPFDTATP